MTFTSPTGSSSNSRVSLLSLSMTHLNKRSNAKLSTRLSRTFMRWSGRTLRRALQGASTVSVFSCPTQEIWFDCWWALIWSSTMHSSNSVHTQTRCCNSKTLIWRLEPCCQATAKNLVVSQSSRGRSSSGPSSVCAGCRPSLTSIMSKGGTSKTRWGASITPSTMT